MAGQPRVGAAAQEIPPLPSDVVLDECVAAFGIDLVAYLTGAGADEPLATWRLVDALREQVVRERLATAHDVLHELKEPPRARAWLRNVNLDLGRRSPAEVIRTASDQVALDRVRQAAAAAVGL